MYLQELEEELADQDLVVLGFDSADREEIALPLLRKHEVTFPTVLDTSTRAQLLAYESYQAMAVPTTYIIDRDGKVATAWIGFEKDGKRMLRELGKLGIE